MKVILAEKAGFCFGVKRAVDTAFEKAEEAAASGRSIYSYGPVIHNEEVVKRLEDKGVKILNSLEDIVNIPKDSLIILRSHGVGKDVYETIEAAGQEYVDTTCPFVKNIHKIVDEKSKEGAAIILIGNPGHAEVEGTLGHCSGDAYVVDSEEDIRSLPDFKDRDIVVVEQTTYSLKKFKELVAVLQEIYYNVNVCKTICNATEERQNEAAELSKEVDSMIVIGGKTSSNTQKLYEISRQHCANTYYIQTLDDMDFTVLESASRVGITAGASTPNFIIKEVHDRMSELSFEEMLKNEENVSIRSGQVVDGVVVPGGDAGGVDAEDEHAVSGQGAVPLGALAVLDDEGFLPDWCVEPVAAVAGLEVVEAERADFIDDLWGCEAEGIALEEGEAAGSATVVVVGSACHDGP